MNATGRTAQVDIDGYRIVRTLGTGGMATVYLTQQTGLGRTVALKLLAAEHGMDADAVTRFENEARTIARLDHPHIVRIHDVGRSADGRLYFTMPYLPHGDLAHRPDRHQPLRIVEIMRALLDALAYAHERGVVHRDVKPENVLFDAANKPHLADFGIALDSDAMRRVTQVGATVGSSGYMSPEQARGLPTDGRSDLYSVGVMLYELLAGEMPYQGPDALSVAIAHVEDPIPQLPAARRAWQPLIDGALAKRPEDRFATAREMLAELERIAPHANDGGGFLADVRYAWRRWQTHNRGALIGAAAAVTALALLWLLWQQARTPETNAAQSGVSGVTAAPTTPILGADELDRLIREGNTRVALGALTEPAGNSAADRFVRILQVYPNSPEALAGMSDVCDGLASRIDEALDRGDGARALGLYQQSQQLADRAGIRQQPFWTSFVDSVRQRTRRALARAVLRAPARLPALKPMADALELPLPATPQEAIAVAESAPAPTQPLLQAGMPLHDDGGPALVVVSTATGHGYAMSQQAISVADYARFAKASGRAPSRCRRIGNVFTAMLDYDWRNPGRAQQEGQSVACVSWNDARAYLGWLSQRTGQRYRLPSAAEWGAARNLAGALAVDDDRSDWLRCDGACARVDYRGAGGNGDSAPDAGYTSVGFRALRELDDTP
jgi:hypothetical protein